jgi:hypothetical protein
MNGEYSRQVEKLEMHTKFLSEIMKGRGRLEDLGVADVKEMY